MPSDSASSRSLACRACGFGLIALDAQVKESGTLERVPDLRREWDLNPRCPKDTTVFETVRFGRSRIPPAAIMR